MLSAFKVLIRFVMRSRFHLTPKQTEGSLEGIIVFMYMCLRVYTACVSIYLPSVTLNRISSLENGCMDGAITALPGRWHQMDRGSSEISRGLLINKVIGDNGAIRAMLYA